MPCSRLSTIIHHFREKASEYGREQTAGGKCQLLINSVIAGLAPAIYFNIKKKEKRPKLGLEKREKDQFRVEGRRRAEEVDKKQILSWSSA